MSRIYRLLLSRLWSGSKKSEQAWDFIPTLTGIGYLSGESEIIADVDPALRYSDDFGSLESYPIFYRSGHFWAFAMHSSCWNILFLRASDCAMSEIARH
ncbi:MAG: hypothetical protein M1830_010067 [Pleopsidium flavum]|nr:MAG: hypothetical protein M1830_010067 [Pleopsidium flavum]